MERMNKDQEKTLGEQVLGYIAELEEENKKLKEDYKVLGVLNDEIRRVNEKLRYDNKKLKETIKEHKLYEERLEHRIIEFEELLHGE